VVEQSSNDFAALKTAETDECNQRTTRMRVNDVAVTEKKINQQKYVKS
jgi:hypothetical protein